MTLDHLRITNTAFARFITTLADNKSPRIVVDTAAVKPSPDLSSDIEEAFEQSCDAVIEAAQKAKQLKSQTRHRHPWFGELDAFQWLALASLHLGIHRSQIEAISSALPR